jgi:hypothetical protein
MHAKQAVLLERLGVMFSRVYHSLIGDEVHTCPCTLQLHTNIKGSPESQSNNPPVLLPRYRILLRILLRKSADIIALALDRHLAMTVWSSIWTGTTCRAA